MGGFGAGEGNLAAGQLARCPLAVCDRRASPPRWPAAAAPRRDRRGEGEKKGRGSIKFFLKF
jgi:hypothetical protein